MDAQRRALYRRLLAGRGIEAAPDLRRVEAALHLPPGALSDAPPHAGTSPSPEVLAALCEGSADRKRTGTYYTSADVARYLCAGTIVPRLFSMAGAAAIGRFPPVADAPDRYLRPWLRSPARHPRETADEHAARRQRYAATRSALEAGAVRTAAEALTWNLDLEPLARDFACGLRPAEAEAFRRECLERITVLDPTCGSGAFLLAALGILLPLYRACDPEAPEAASVASVLTRSLFGMDLSDTAVETCRMRLLFEFLRRTGCAGLSTALDHLRLNIAVGDATRVPTTRSSTPRTAGPTDVRGGPPELGGRGGYDVVIGNPPYVRTAGAGYNNLYADVVERSLDLLAPSGHFGMVLPVSCVSVPEYRPLFEKLARGDCWISTYSNRPAKLFEGVEQRLAIVITGPSQEPRVYASAYQHWYADERADLLDRLTYAEASSWRGMPIKSGGAAAESVFRKLTTHQGTLATLERPGDAAVWLHDGPTYWVRALPFDPQEGCGASSHYHRITVATPEDARILAAVLSSTTFYFFYKMISNCRDLGRREWTAFPLDPLPEPRRAELARLGSRMADRLRATARTRQRLYPRGAVEYREYYPAVAKEIIDGVEAVLAEHYGFTAGELDYVRGYDLKYRMGADVRG